MLCKINDLLLLSLWDHGDRKTQKELLPFKHLESMEFSEKPPH